MTVNADSGASNLFVDPDERYVVFGVVHQKGLGGLDLYISCRNGDTWTPAKNLGPLVNTGGTEFCPYVSRAAGITPMTRDVYVVRFDGLREQLR